MHRTRIASVPAYTAALRNRASALARVVPVLSFLALSGSGCASFTAPAFEARTTHFRVLSQEGMRSAVYAALALERFHGTVSQVYGIDREKETPALILILHLLGPSPITRLVSCRFESERWRRHSTTVSVQSMPRTPMRVHWRV